MERDLTRKKISTANISEKPLLKAKYKQLRNITIAQMRKNGEKIAKARNEGETWKIVNKIIKPKAQVTIVINGLNGEISEEKEVSDAFNLYFVNKISNLKKKIDPKLISDPLKK